MIDRPELVFSFIGRAGGKGKAVSSPGDGFRPIDAAVARRYPAWREDFAKKEDESDRFNPK